jgi:hypothetical protein
MTSNQLRGVRKGWWIFTNLYGHHGADLKSSMKYGDWYRTKDIISKGDVRDELLKALAIGNSLARQLCDYPPNHRPSK